MLLQLKIGRAGAYAAYSLCIAISIVFVCEAVSVIFQSSRPSISLSFNYLNREARISEAVRDLHTAPERAKSLIQNGIVQSPADARFYTVLGIIEEEKGRQKVAEAYYRHALKLLPTEIQSLVRLLNFSIASGDYEQSCILVEWIARRWPQYWVNVSHIVPLILKDEKSRINISLRFGREAKLRRLLFLGLIENNQLDYARLLLFAFVKQNISDLLPEINWLTSAYLNQGLYPEAYSLFRLTIAKDHFKNLVFNGNFGTPFTGSPFDWRLERQAGVSISRIPHKEEKLDQSSSRSSALEIRFLNSPIRLRNVYQKIRLVPARYRVKVVSSAKSLRAPEPVRLFVTCDPVRQQLGMITLPTTDTLSSTFETEIEVPDVACPIQLIYFSNGHVAESWRKRYDGIIYIEDVSIELDE